MSATSLIEMCRSGDKQCDKHAFDKVFQGQMTAPRATITLGITPTFLVALCQAAAGRPIAAAVCSGKNLRTNIDR